MLATILTIAAAAGAVGLLNAAIGARYAARRDARTARSIARMRAAR